MSNVYDMRDYQVSEKRPDPYSEAASRARWARIEAAHEEMAKNRVELEASLKKLSEETQETRRMAQETHREVQEAVRVSREAASMVGGAGCIQGGITEEFFHAALRRERRIGALKFDKIRSNHVAKYRGDTNEYDLLLINSKLVAVVEVKHNLRGGDVEVMREVRAPHARLFLQKFCVGVPPKKLMFVMAYMTAHLDALKLVRKYGYATLSPDGQQARADLRYVRFVPPAEEE